MNKFITACAFIFILLFLANPAYAACVDPIEGIKIKECFGFGNITSLGDATSRLVVPAFSLAAVAVVIYFLMGAFKFLHSAGNKEEAAAARSMITHAIIGFMILIFIFFIIPFLLAKLLGVRNFILFY